MVGQTRIHLDSVESLGAFLELEVVLAPGQATEQAEVIARDLMARLGVEPSALVESAYIDLLENAQTD